MTTSPEQEIAEADEAYLTFGGWAKAMPHPPRRTERRRYTVDVECTGAGVTSSEKGERHTRKLSILRVVEVKDAKVPPADTDENQGALFEGDIDGETDAGDTEAASETDGDGWDADADNDNVTSIKEAKGK